MLKHVSNPRDNFQLLEFIQVSLVSLLCLRFHIPTLSTAYSEAKIRRVNKKSWHCPWVPPTHVPYTTLTCAGAGMIPYNKGAHQRLTNVGVIHPSLQNWKLSIIFFIKYIVSITILLWYSGSRKGATWGSRRGERKETNQEVYCQGLI